MFVASLVRCRYVCPAFALVLTAATKQRLVFMRCQQRTKMQWLAVHVYVGRKHMRM